MPNTIEAKITQKTGALYVERNGERLSLDIGDGIYEADLIITGSETTAEIQYRDGTKSRLAPDTQMRLVDFEFDTASSANNSFLVNMAEGAMRTVSGEIVKLNPEGFEVVTPRATVGIRGTEFYTLVRNGDETHALLMLENGHEMLVQGNNSQVSLVIPLQMTQINANESAKLLIQSLTTQQMTDLIRFNSPTLAEKLPNNPSEQGEWEELLTQFIYERSQENEDGEGEEVSLTVSRGSLSSQEILDLLSTGVVDKITVVDTDVEGLSIATSESLTQEELDEIASLVFDTEDDLIFEEGSSSSAPDPDPIDYHTFATFDQGILELGDSRNNVTVAEMTGGEIHLQGGNDSISISAMGASASQVAPPAITRAIQPGVVPAKPYVDAGTGDDDIYIGEMTQGTINGNDGDDFIAVTSFKHGEIHTGDGNDYVYIESALKSNIVLDTSLYLDGGHDTVKIDNFSLAEIYLADRATIEITNFGSFINLANTIITNDASVNTSSIGSLKLTIDNAANGEINSFDANDTITITDFGDVTLSTAGGSDSIEITNFNDGSVNTGDDSDIIAITNFNDGSLITGNDNDNVTIGTLATTVTSLNLGEGDDTLTITNSANNQFVELGNGHDSVSVNILSGGYIYLGDGNDTIKIADMNNGEVKTMGGNNSVIVNSDFNGQIRLGGGQDYITLTGNSTVTGTFNLYQAPANSSTKNSILEADSATLYNSFNSLSNDFSFFVFSHNSVSSVADLASLGFTYTYSSATGAVTGNYDSAQWTLSQYGFVNEDRYSIIHNTTGVTIISPEIFNIGTNPFVSTTPPPSGGALAAQSVGYDATVDAFTVANSGYKLVYDSSSHTLEEVANAGANQTYVGKDFNFELQAQDIATDLELSLDGVDNQTINMTFSTKADELFISTFSATSTSTFNMGNGDDTITFEKAIEGGSLLTNTTINAGEGNDLFNFNEPLADSTVFLNGDAGNDTIKISSYVQGTSGKVNAGDDNDFVFLDEVRDAAYSPYNEVAISATEATNFNGGDGFDIFRYESDLTYNDDVNTTLFNNGFEFIIAGANTAQMTINNVSDLAQYGIDLTINHPTGNTLEYDPTKWFTSSGNVLNSYDTGMKLYYSAGLLINTTSNLPSNIVTLNSIDASTVFDVSKAYYIGLSALALEKNIILGDEADKISTDFVSSSNDYTIDLGNGNNSFTGTTSSATGKATLISGNGNDTFTFLENSEFISLNTGGGDDKVIFNSLNNKAIEINLGEGNNTLSAYEKLLNINYTVSANATDTFTIDSDHGFTAVTGVITTEANSHLNFTAYSDNAFDEPLAGLQLTINGTANIDIESLESGNSFIKLEGSETYTVKIDTLGDDNDASQNPTITAANGSTVHLEMSSLNNHGSVTLGDGNDTANISFINGTLITGGGNDTITTSSAILGDSADYAQIQTGAGDDIIRQDGDQSRYIKFANIDLGEGNDILYTSGFIYNSSSSTIDRTIELGTGHNIFAIENKNDPTSPTSGSLYYSLENVTMTDSDNDVNILMVNGNTLPIGDAATRGFDVLLQTDLANWADFDINKFGLQVSDGEVILGKGWSDDNAGNYSYDNGSGITAELTIIDSDSATTVQEAYSTTISQYSVV